MYCQKQIIAKLIPLYINKYKNEYKAGEWNGSSYVVTDAKRSFLYPKETKDNEAVVHIINFAFLQAYQLIKSINLHQSIYRISG